ncbi:DUF2441 domain-containing protein [Flavihumibacter profundi]|uniref:DUF2441 domain-containing protein n=1 Tax=Flavihumibacter profundi TaxID=2716883 RepID=UPI001CC3ED35|nr:DUF2441 domain-containing protein [Flavihumibacter profundi]MBZ5857582.1 DUF2441 domain-containing protein [Flavihumibacter profundi]
MKYFKVVESLSSDVIIDTKTTNYSLTLVDKDRHFEFLNCIIQSSKELDLPFDFYFTLNNNLAMFGNEYLRNLPRSNNGVFEILQLTQNINHRNLFIEESDLIFLVEKIDKIGISFFEKGYYLWEHILEDIRLLNYPDKPSRQKSFFLFDNIESCKYYINNHIRIGTICEVKLLEINSLFKADMNWLDTIPSKFTIKQANQQVENYWMGNSMGAPLFEYLFQGKCMLIPI